MDLLHIAEFVILGRSQYHPGTASAHVFGPVKVHPPIVGVWWRWFILRFSPVDEKIRQNMGLDGIPLLVCRIIWSELNCSFGNSAAGIFIAHYFRDRRLCHHPHVVL